MEAHFYWQALRRYWLLVILPVVVTVATLVAIDVMRGPQFQSSMYFLVNSPYSLTSRDYAKFTGGSVSPSGEDQVPAPFDFANIATSLQVAAKTIADLNLPIRSAVDLFKPPILELRPPSVQVEVGQPQGDAADEGLMTELLGLSSSSGSERLFATSRWVELIVQGYDPDQTEQIARVYASNALEYYRKVQSQGASQAQRQVLAHAQQARQRLDAGESELAQFEVQNSILSGGSEFQTAQATLEELRRQRTDLIGAIGGQTTTSQRLADLEAQIAVLEGLVERSAKAAGETQAKVQGQRVAAQTRVTSAQSGYDQGLQAHIAGQREVSLARSLGFPPTQRTVQSTQTIAGQTTASTTETQEAFSSQSAQEQGGLTTASSSNQSSTTASTATRAETSGSSTSCDEVPCTTVYTSQGTTTTVPASTQSIVTSSTTSTPPNRSTTTTTTPSRTNMVSSTTTTAPATSTILTDTPTAIQSEQQGTRFLAGLAQTVDGHAAELIGAQQQLAGVEASDPTPALNNQLAVNREKLSSLRAAQTTLLRVDVDPAAALNALDQRIVEQDQRIALLNAIGPQFRRLTLNVQQARAQFEETLQLADRYSRLQADSSAGAGVVLLDEPYTMKLASKAALLLGFGAMIAILFGISLAFGMAYVRYLRSGGGPSGPVTIDGNGAVTRPQEIPTYGRPVIAGSSGPHSSSPST